MALIDLKSVHIDFPVYGVSSRSLKKQLLRISTGGRFGSKEDHVVKIKALDDITLKIDHGERVGLIGHNGSGKSTLLRVISKIYEPTSGLCSVDGKISSLLDTRNGRRIHRGRKYLFKGNNQWKTNQRKAERNQTSQILEDLLSGK